MEFATDGFVVARRYALGRKIGSGGMGTVWLAHDQSLDRVCAVKIVDPDKAESDEVQKRFLREARATAQIRSPHVVEVYEHGVWDGLPFMVMEYLEGEELSTRLERVGALEPEAAYRIIAQVARALARAHALGIIHRDLKPENVFLVPADGGEIVKVLDFGIAHHVVYSARDRATQAGAVLGTPCYMSPEQALGEATDWRSDIWALGVLAFQCLTGKLPFYHDALGGLLVQVLHEPIPSIRAVKPELPEAIEAWWQRASARDPEQRFQTAAELSDELADALGVSERLAVPDLVPGSETLRMDVADFEGASDSASEFAVRMTSDAPVTSATGEIITQFKRKARRRTFALWGLVVALCGGLVAGAFWFRGRVVRPASSSLDDLGLPLEDLPPSQPVAPPGRVLAVETAAPPPPVPPAAASQPASPEPEGPPVGQAEAAKRGHEPKAAKEDAAKPPARPVSAKPAKTAAASKKSSKRTSAEPERAAPPRPARAGEKAPPAPTSDGIVRELPDDI